MPGLHVRKIAAALSEAGLIAGVGGAAEAVVAVGGAAAAGAGLVLDPTEGYYHIAGVFVPLMTYDLNSRVCCRTWRRPQDCPRK